MKKQLTLAASAIFGLVALALLFMSWYTIDGGDKGIILRFGNPVEVVGGGLHFKNPITESLIEVNARTRKTEAPASAGTKDLQTVSTSVAINYHLDPSRLMETYSNYGLNMSDSVINPRIQETVKAVVAKFSAEQLLTARAEVKDQIQTELSQSLAKYNIVLEGVQVTNFRFSKAFDDAIENKQTAEQNALTAKNNLEKVKYESEQAIVRAQAEAQSIKIQAETLKAQGGESYVQLKAIEKWDGKLPTYSGGGSVPFLNLSK